MNKHLLPLLLALFLSVGLFSCKKNYTCVCTTIDPGITQGSSSSSVSASSKSKAEDECKKNNVTIGTRVTTCAIN